VVSFDNSNYVKTSGNGSTVSLGRFGGSFIDTFRGNTALSFNDGYTYDGDYARGLMSFRVKNGDGYSLFTYQGNTNDWNMGRIIALGYASNANINNNSNSTSVVMSFRDGCVNNFTPNQVTLTFSGTSTTSNTASFPFGFDVDNCFVIGYRALPQSGAYHSGQSNYINSINILSNGISATRPSPSSSMTLNVYVFLVKYRNL
jgi:hypothetical protein